MEPVHDIPEVLFTYDGRKYIDAHLCSIGVIELYSNHLAVHLDASKERILEEYKKNYELEEMPRARVTRPLAEAPADDPPACPDFPKNFGEQTRRLLNDRAAAVASTNDTRMVVIEDRPAEVETPPHPYNFVYAAFCLKLKATLEIIHVSGWGVFIQQYQFNELDDRMSKLEKGQNVNNSAEETAMELDGEMSMDADLIVKFITQQVAAAMNGGGTV